MKDFSAIVIGAGHAGIEASLALSRQGFKTILITQNFEAIGRMSCNPSIGGLAKGNIVREIDALGGEMAHLADKALIQMKILNKRRGAAVQAPRAQEDKFLYSALARRTLEEEKNLSLFMDTVTDIMVENGKAIGVVTERGIKISSSVIVLTTGTFMDGKVFIGSWQETMGRLGERAAIGLGENLRKKGFKTGRLKTGTPARVRLSSINLCDLAKEEGDEKMESFSFQLDYVLNRATLPCYVTYTNLNTHDIIRNNLGQSPLYSGKIVGKGPRYCPSIEDKVVRFPERDRHQIFIEREGENSEEIYLNGLSTSLPENVQEMFIHSIKGLEDAEIMRPGYAVEYDFLDPRDLFPSLESKILRNLFIAGQTNGTSGYEEAACQGLMAGINAAEKLKGQSPIILPRSSAYIGVLIDDLVTKGTEEPYRMFTSRAEHRLSLRHDTADRRLTRIGRNAGLVKDEAFSCFLEKERKIEEIIAALKENRINDKTMYDYLKEADADILSLPLPSLSSYSPVLLSTVERDIKYSGYIQREEKEIEREKRSSSFQIPEDFDYESVPGLSSESREKLKKIRPLSIAQASNISGIRVTDIALLTLYLKKKGANS